MSDSKDSVSKIQILPEWDDPILEEVPKYPVLFDPFHPETKSINARQHAWNQIAKIAAGSDNKIIVTKIKQRWKSIRDSYVKSIKSKTISMNSSKGEKRKSLGRYKYEDRLEFLAPFVKYGFEESVKNDEERGERIINSSISSSENSDVDPEGVELDSTPYVIIDDDDSQDYSLPVDIVCGAEGEDEPPKKRLYYHFDDEDSDYEGFFMCLAETFPTLKPETAKMLRKKISNMVMDAEISDMNDSNDV